MATNAILVNAMYANSKKGRTEVAMEPEQIPCALLAEEKAALLIGRAWRKRNQKRLLKRDILIERLMLEDALCVGLLRLICFLLIFFLLIYVTSLGVSAKYNLGVVHHIEDKLDLGTFKDIKSLPALRNYVPDLGQRIKDFALASNNRFVDSFSKQLIGSMTSFINPLSIYEDINIDRPEFTLTAWINPTSPVEGAIIRKPMPSDTSLSCWGWYYPSLFKYGAHDFHTTDSKQKVWEQVVQVNAEASGLTHEAIVIYQGTITFYRNGKQIQEPVNLPRDITDCSGGNIELGNSQLSIASLKFYARALRRNEIAEMFYGGQPLTELATGSSLSGVERNPLDQVMATIQSTDGIIQRENEDVKEQTLYNNVLNIAMLGTNGTNPDDDVVIYPEDLSSATALPSCKESALTEREKQFWTESGKLCNWSASNAHWKNDTFGTYWPLIQGTIYGDNKHGLTKLPPLTDEVEVVTFTWWNKPLMPYRMYECSPLMNGEDATKNPVVVKLSNYGHFIGGDVYLNLSTADYLLMNADGTPATTWMGEWPAVFDPETGRDEKYYHTIRSGEPGPTAWRFMAAQFDFRARAFCVFLDGKLLLNSTLGCNLVRSLPCPARA
eukprot:762467-Hanusia_phi.AAC.3